jgi:hypothetical protein
MTATMKGCREMLPFGGIIVIVLGTQAMAFVQPLSWNPQKHEPQQSEESSPVRAGNGDPGQMHGDVLPQTQAQSQDQHPQVHGHVPDSGLVRA